MAKSQKEIKGMLYNLRSVIEGMIKLNETGALPPEQLEDALIKAITTELQKGNEQ